MCPVNYLPPAPRDGTGDWQEGAAGIGLRQPTPPSFPPALPTLCFRNLPSQICFPKRRHFQADSEEDQGGTEKAALRNLWA